MLLCVLLCVLLLLCVLRCSSQVSGESKRARQSRHWYWTGPDIWPSDPSSVSKTSHSSERQSYTLTVSVVSHYANCHFIFNILYLCYCLLVSLYVASCIGNADSKFKDFIVICTTATFNLTFLICNVISEIFWTVYFLCLNFSYVHCLVFFMLLQRKHFPNWDQ